MHHSKVRKVEARLNADNVPHFVHKTVRYYKKRAKHGVQRQELQTVSGLVFLQGNAKELQEYLNWNFPNTYLCKNCSTGKAAVIPDSQMRPFMRINETEPDRIRFLLKPFHYYARNRVLLRISSGDLAGLEGYVIRIDRDRRLIMEVGGMSVAIAGVHAEHFEEVDQTGSAALDGSPFYERNLHEREALIDRFFHPVKSAKDVAPQADNIDYLRNYVLTELSQYRMLPAEAWLILSFIIKEIGYYYAPSFEKLQRHLAPIMQAGTQVLQEMQRLIDSEPAEETRNRYQTEQQELLTTYGYLFMDSDIAYCVPKPSESQKKCSLLPSDSNKMTTFVN